jgi:AcrR family transcriptional regulator
MEAATGTRHDGRKARTRGSLLAAARKLFSAQGVDATTIAEIAEEADVGVGSFYNHFQTKEDLLAVLLEEALGEQLAQLQSRRAQVDDTAEVVSLGHRHMVRMAQTDPEWGWLLVRRDIEYQRGKPRTFPSTRAHFAWKATRVRSRGRAEDRRVGSGGRTALRRMMENPENRESRGDALQLPDRNH